MAIPYCLYGAEDTTYREAYIGKLEKTQNIMGRWGYVPLDVEQWRFLKET